MCPGDLCVKLKALNSIGGIRMKTVAAVRIMIVDDHEALRQSIKLALLPYDDFSLVGEAANGVEAVNLCPVVKPNVVIMDLNMPEMDGVTATSLIRQHYPQVKIIILTSFTDESLQNAAISAGASAHLLKNVSIDELAAAIRRVSDKPANGVPEAKSGKITNTDVNTHTGD